jgi:predicted PurR-regulated permease PerM
MPKVEAGFQGGKDSATSAQTAAELLRHERAGVADERADRVGVVDIALRLALVAGLGFACLRIALPFLPILSWAVLLAIMLWPLHQKLRARPGFTNARSASLIGVLGVALLLVPAVAVAVEIGISIIELAKGVMSGTVRLPSPPPGLAEGGPFANQIHAVWEAARANLSAFAQAHVEQFKALGQTLANTAGDTAIGLLVFVVAIGISAVILAWGAESAALMDRIFVRVTGDEAKGKRLVRLSAATVRGVLQGVVGVALIQATLMGIGFFVAGVPFAGVLSLVALLMSIIQLPPPLLALPTIAWAWGHLDPTKATLFTIWILLASFSDNVLKPLLLGRGMEVPMPVILIGVIGGMLADGLVGLFVGPVLLAVGYVLFLDWLGTGPAAKVPPAA